MEFCDDYQKYVDFLSNVTLDYYIVLIYYLFRID